MLHWGGAAASAAAAPGLTHASSSLPAFRFSPAKGSPPEAFGANPIWVEAVPPGPASWHDSSSLTATMTAIGHVKCHSLYHRNCSLSGLCWRWILHLWLPRQQELSMSALKLTAFALMLSVSWGVGIFCQCLFTHVMSPLID